MKADNLTQIRSERVWLSNEHCDIDEFRALVERTTDKAEYPFAAAVEKNVLVYDGDAVREAAKDPATRKALLAEWVEAMTDGPGVVAFNVRAKSLSLSALSTAVWAEALTMTSGRSARTVSATPAGLEKSPQCSVVSKSSAVTVPSTDRLRCSSHPT